MNYINSAIALFNGQTQSAAITLAVVAFVAGMVIMCLLCKLCRPCGKKSCGGRRGDRRGSERKGEDRPFEKRKPHPAPADGSVEIYVGNLSYETTEEQLRVAFAEYGTVNSARLISNRYNGKSKGFGFVQMPNRAEAEKAIAALNGKDFQGREMRCNEAKNLI